MRDRGSRAGWRSTSFVNQVLKAAAKANVGPLTAAQMRRYGGRGSGGNRPRKGRCCRIGRGQAVADRLRRSAEQRGPGERGPEALLPGKHVLEFDFKYDGLGIGTLAFNSVSGIGRSGTGVLNVNGKEVASQTMERTLPLILQWDENFDVGADTGTPVDDNDYQVPFRFTGKLDKLTLTIDRPRLTPEDEKRLSEAQRNNRTSE
jgi:hypothetical protein